MAFAVLRKGAACDERELLAFCESRLGPFKTPTRIFFVDGPAKRAVGQGAATEAGGRGRGDDDVRPN